MSNTNTGVELLSLHNIRGRPLKLQSDDGHAH